VVSTSNLRDVSFTQNVVCDIYSARGIRVKTEHSRPYNDQRYDILPARAQRKQKTARHACQFVAE
jgi:hypothetical protein